MQTRMKAKIKRDFDGKVSNIVCHKLNELCGQKWTREELREFLNSANKCYLNEIGRKVMIDRSKVNYVSAIYILVFPEQFITSKGEQLYVWLYRKNTNESFGKINIGVEDDFDYEVVEKYYAMTKDVKH